jgi:hypothetical protein
MTQPSGCSLPFGAGPRVHVVLEALSLPRLRLPTARLSPVLSLGF